MALLDLTMQNFDKDLDDNPFMVIDFWAQWCAPCKDFARVCTELADEIKDVCFARVDIEAEPELAAEFSIQSVPFVIIMRERTILYAESGSLTKSALHDLIKQAMEVDLEKSTD